MPKYHCPHCQESLVFENGNKFTRHQGQCRRWKKNNKNEETSNDILSDLLEEGKRINQVTKREREIKLLHERDPTFLGGGEFIPAKVDDRIHESYFDPEEVEEQEQTKRAQPEEEALGYNTTMLLSKKTVGQRARECIAQDMAARERAAQNTTATNLNSGNWYSGSIHDFYDSEEEVGAPSDDESYVIDVIEKEEEIEEEDENADSDEVEEKDEHSSTEEMSQEDEGDEEEGQQQQEEDVNEGQCEEGKTFDRKDIPSFPGFKCENVMDRKAYEKHDFNRESMDPMTIALLDLMMLLNGHACDLNLFDEIVVWLMEHFKDKGSVLDNMNPSVCTTRKTFIQKLRKTYGREELKPMIHQVTLPHSKREVSLPVFNFEAQVADFIHHLPYDQLNQPNFNPTTWLQVEDVQEYPTIIPDTSQEQANEERLKHFSHLGKKEYPPSIDDLVSKEIILQVKYMNEEIKPCHGVVKKIKNKSKRSVMVDWDDDKSPPWEVFCTSAKWRSREEGGWCLSSDPWASESIQAESDGSDLSDIDSTGSNDNDNESTAPNLNDIVTKKVIVSCLMDVLDEDHNVTDETTNGWFQGTVTSVINACKGKVMIDWVGYDEVSHELLSSNWEKDVNTLGAWKIIHETSQLPDIVNKVSSLPTKIDNSVPIGDLYTGSAMTEGLRNHFKDIKKPLGVTLIRPLPVTFFIDASHVDLHGSLTTTPISYSLGVLPRHLRNQHGYNKNLAYIPNLKVGQGKYHDKADLVAYLSGKSRRKRGDKRTPSARGKLQDYHHLLNIAFQSFRKCCEKGILLDQSYMGKERVLYIPFVLLVMGDTSGNNDLTCHFNNSGQLESATLNYMCLCKPRKMLETPPRCVPITREMIMSSLRNEQYASSISQHPVISSFYYLPLANPTMGLPYLMPKDMLHVFLVGIYQKVVRAIHNIIGVNKRNAKYKDFLDMLHQRISFQIQKSSQRDIPKAANRFGVMDGTRRSGKERMGDLFVLLACFHTQQGIHLMKPFLQRINVNHNNFVGTIELLLSYEAWVSKTPPSRSDLVESMPVICDLVNAIVKYLPTQETTRKELSEAVSNCTKKAAESSPARKKSKTSVEQSNTAVGNGHITVKMHSLLWFPLYIQRFGIGLGFDTSAGEQHHKESVKYPGNNTSRQQSKFTEQVTLQNSDRDVVREIHRWVHSGDDVIAQSTSKQSRNFIKGNYTMEIVATDDLQEVIQCKTLWKDYNKRVDKDSYKLNKFIAHAIVCEAREHGYFGVDSTKNTIVISGYTEAKFAAKVATTGASSDDFIIRASPRYRGEERYDWCIVKVPFSERKKDLMDSSNTSLAEVPFHSFAKVLGFIQYRNPDYPTFHSRNGNVSEHEDNR